jgi:catechol 2,3-dioxygenase-like lactoylglutathione lyase family enzyme
MNETGKLTHIGDVRTVAIPVADQERALAFYVEKLGFEKRMDAEFGDGQRWIEVAAPGASTTIALAHQEGASAGTDTGIRLTSLDVAGDHARLHERGVDVDAKIIPFPVPMFSFRDADGNRLVIVGEGGQP